MLSLESMHLKKLKLIQSFFCMFSLVFLIASVFCYFLANHNFDQDETRFVKRQLPVLAFAAGNYNTIDEQFLPLTHKSPRMHPPDLRNHLIYYGLNGRPDASGETQKMHFGFQNGKMLQSITPNEKIYLSFDKKLPTAIKYTFSLDNAPTLVWFAASAEDKNALVRVFMQDEEGHLLSDEDPYVYFTLAEKEWTRPTALAGWELGKWRVDGTLLARQKARWVGVDCFLENHGGDEFNQFQGKHRIDFGEGEESYSLFATKGDCFVWENERWHIVTPGINSLNKPLLAIKKIEDRLMMLELWDTDGKSKMALNLIKMVEPVASHNIINSFKFLAARTRTRVVFQIDNTRMIVRPHDWFILTQEGWRKLKTSEEIDQYVNRQIVGPLFVFEEIVKKDDRPVVMLGTLYNAGRTEMQTIELAMTPSIGSEPQKNIKETVREDQKLVTQNK